MDTPSKLARKLKGIGRQMREPVLHSWHLHMGWQKWSRDQVLLRRITHNKLIPSTTAANRACATAI